MAEWLFTELGKMIGEKAVSEVWNRIMGAADTESQIKELKDLKTTIEAKLLDEDSAQDSNHSQRDVLEKLRCALAEIIDLQDAREAKAKQKQLMGGSKLAKELCLFFSSSNQLVSYIKYGWKIKGITGEVSRILTNNVQFGSIVVGSSSSNQTRTLSNELGVYMCNEMVVGRDGDKDKMVRMLLNPPSDDDIPSVASIVGMGGIGKTTLAKYVFHDEMIVKNFDLRLWAFTTQDFDLEDMLRQIVEVGCPTDDGRQLLDRLLGCRHIESKVCRIERVATDWGSRESNSRYHT